MPLSLFDSCTTIVSRFMISPAVNYHQDFVCPFVGVRGRVRLLIIVTEKVLFSTQIFSLKNVTKDFAISTGTFDVSDIFFSTILLLLSIFFFWSPTISIVTLTSRTATTTATVRGHYQQLAVCISRTAIVYLPLPSIIQRVLCICSVVDFFLFFFFAGRCAADGTFSQSGPFIRPSKNTFTSSEPLINDVVK